jgi:hypothetical protein
LILRGNLAPKFTHVVPTIPIHPEENLVLFGRGFEKKSYAQE